MLGHVHLSRGDRTKAAAAFERALTLRPGDPPALIWLGEMYLDAGRFADAEAPFMKAAAGPAAAAAVSGAGRAALARGGYKEAVDRLARALEIDSQAGAIHYPLAMAYRALGDQARAEEHLRQRRDGWPTFPDPLMTGQQGLLETVGSSESRGVQAITARDWRTAVAAFRRGLEIDPNDAALRHRLATALYAAGDEAAAMNEFDELLRRHPGFAKGYVSLGRILNVKGRYQEAADRFQAALRIDSDDAAAHSGLGEALRVSGRMADALPHYQRAIAIDPAAPEPWIGGAMALIGLRRTEVAREWLANARRVHPDLPQLSELERMLR
jgi:superkiller protein 3